MTEDKNQEKIPRENLSRRGFLGAGTLAAAALATPAKALARDLPESETLIAQSSGSTSSNTTYEPFAEPHVVCSQNGEINLDMTVGKTDFTYRCGDRTVTVPARHFSNFMPGPTMVIDPGDKIKLHLTNNLQGNPNCPGELNTPTCFNTTNMHFHGLHVSPESYYDPVTGEKILSSDDVLYELEPGMSHNWCVWLPEFHAPGTHWYHAHRHGATGLQVSNGMAGAIVVREPSKALNIVDPLNDKVFMMQEIIEPSEGQNPDDAVYQRGGQAGQGGTAGDFLINGRCQPTIDMQAGKIQRWRFINATSTPRGLMTLKLCQATGPDDTSTTCTTTEDMYLMAVDGISFYGKPPEPIGPSNKRSPQWTGWQMASGNRADFLVQLYAADHTTPQWYKLIKDAHPGSGGSTSPQILAYVKVQPASFKECIPSRIPGSLSNFPYLTPITKNDLANKKGDTICPRELAFGVTQSGGPQGYKVNGQLYCPSCANIEVQLGTAEEWQLSHGDPANGLGGKSAHPFHIHVNPFQIVGDKIDPNGPNRPDNWRWWDTIALFSGTNASQMQPVGSAPLHTRQWFFDYNGTYVFHCHILIHEDQGMMMNVTVNGDGTPPCYSLDRDGNSHPGKEIPPGSEVYPPLKGCDPDKTCSGTNASAVKPTCPAS